MIEIVGQVPAADPTGTTATHLTSFRCQAAVELPWKRSASARYTAVTDIRTDEDDSRSQLRTVYARQAGSNGRLHKT